MYRFIVFFLHILAFTLLCSNALAGVVSFGPTADSQVVEGSPTFNYGTSTSVYIASASGGTYLDERGWLKFDLTGQIPPGATIHSAKLRLNFWRADETNDLEIAVHGSTDDSWTEGGITWNNQPSYQPAAQSQTTLVANDSDVWVTMDVTGFVQSEVVGGDTVVSLVVKPVVEGQEPWRSYAFNSKERDAASAPKLLIEYSGTWPTTGAVKIIHVNDVHSRILPHDFDVPSKDDVSGMEVVGGAAYFTTKLLELKAANPEALVLDAGDLSEGNPLGDLRSNGGMVDYYSLLDTKLKALGGRGIDAVVVGNHDVRSAEMLTNMQNASFPTISMNIVDANSGALTFPESVIVQSNGTRVGVLGYTTDTSSFLGDDLVGVIEVKKVVWDDSDPDTINAKDRVEHLRNNEGCDIVVLLSHVGHSRVVSGDDAIIADTGGVLPPEVVIAGHWHTMTERVWAPSSLNGKTILAEAASYMQYIGELDVTSNGKYIGSQKHVIRNSEILPDPDAQAFIASLITEYNNQVPAPPYGIFDVIGYSAVDLSMDKDKWWSVSEYPWAGTNAAGAWITDSMVWSAALQGYPVDLAFQSGGGIRRDNAAGELTYIEIYEAYPWPDDNMIRVQMSGQEIWDWIQEDHMGTSISGGWKVIGHDGDVTSITFNGSPINLGATYNVAISQYMYDHPEIPLSDTTPEDMGFSIRQGVIDYTAQYNTPQNPMYPDGIEPRYELNTEFAGGFKAVVTMTADSENQPYFEEVFIRLVEALPETVARRDGYGLSELVNPDGSINMDHRFSEILLYRSHLGFTDGLLQTGDIIEVWGEGGSFEGIPELIDQEGIGPNGEEFVRHGHDTNLARPEYFATIGEFWNEAQENHYVKFYAEKTGTSRVRDSAGQEISVYQPGGYYTKTLPGAVGDLLELTGVVTSEGTSYRFRCDKAVVSTGGAVVGYPPTSLVNPVSTNTSGSSIVLAATASDAAAGSAAGASLAASADTQVVQGYPTTNYGTRTYVYTQSAATGSYRNERAWVKFALAGQIPQGATLTSAKLKLYCWKAQGGDFPTTLHAATDGWTETGLTWNNQPPLGAVLGTQTLVNGQTGIWYEWDITSHIQGEAAGDGVATLVLKATSEDAASTLTYAFDSKEYSGGSLAPVLELQWSDGTVTPPEPTSVEFFFRHAPDGAQWGVWSSIGLDTDSSDGWSQSFAYPSGQGHYEFYSVATDADGNEEETPVRADTRTLFNNAPTVPVNTGIADGATGAPLSVVLSVDVSDPDGAPLNVCFTGGKIGQQPHLLGCSSNVTSGSASLTWDHLEEGADYQWEASATDGLVQTNSVTWGFSTSESVPAVPAANGWAILLMVLSLGYLAASFRRSHRRL